MTIKLHATFAVGSLLLLLSMQPIAKADTIHVVAETNYAVCAELQDACSPVSFSADFTTTLVDMPLQSVFGSFDTVEVIDSMTGTLNGFPAVGGSGGALVPGTNPNYLPLLFPINFMSGGLQWGIGISDTLAAGSPFLISDSQFDFLTWDATLVQTTEPSSLLLLLLGTGGLLVGLALFKNKFRTGVIV